MENKKKLLCIDGNSILNRQFYGIRYLSNKDGFPTNAIFGMANVLIKQLDAIKPDYAAVAFDLKAPTFRHKMYENYKAGRKPMPEELYLQLSVAKEIASALGFTVLQKEGYEADDILGTLSKMAEDNGDFAYVLTGDRDSLQLISDNVSVLLATNNDNIEYTPSVFFEKYGVYPSQFVDVKALMGDSSDNIPGVPGIGEKTALKLIAENNSLDTLYSVIDEIKLTPSVYKKLSENKELAYLSRDLARIDRNSPIGVTLDGISYGGVDKSKARELFLKYELFGAIKKLGLDKADSETSSSESTDTVKEENVYKETKISIDELKNIKDEYVAIDTDNGCVHISYNGNTYVYSGDIKDIEGLLLSNKIICYDAKSFYEYLEEQGIHYRSAHFDIMLAAYVDDSTTGNYSLDRLISAYFEPVSGACTAYYVSNIWKKLEAKLSDSGQADVFYKIEMPLAEVLCDMELIGFKVDKEGIFEYGKVLEKTANELEERIFACAMHPFNINSPKQLSEVLFEELMLPSGKKTKTGYSTGADVLEKLRKYHPIIDDILEYRQVTKLKGTYVDGLLKVVDNEDRIHTSFKQTGTATGRLSSAEPNLQNIPIRTEMGREFRKFFVASDDDKMLIDADYSQIELRVLSHISGDENMINAFNSGDDIHTSTACRVFGISPSDVSIEQRKRAKAINFGILYGMGEYSLSEDLKIPMSKAKEYIKSYLDSYPAIEKYLSDIVDSARRDGYVTTMLGRRRYIPELSASNKNVQNFGERIAKNSPIQGSSADIIKIAMINVSKRLAESDTGARLLLQVHDELIVETKKEYADKVLCILKEEMENAVKLSIPLTVDANIGKTWYESH